VVRASAHPRIRASANARLPEGPGGMDEAMAGGIAILLLIIVLLVVGGIALAMYGTGGFLWSRRLDPEGDKAERPIEGRRGDRERRPQHTRPTNRAQERTDFVGREPHPHG